MSRAKTAKCAKESKNNSKDIKKEFILGDLGVLERALASGREKRMRNSELGTRNEKLASRKERILHFCSVCNLLKADVSVRM